MTMTAKQGLTAVAIGAALAGVALFRPNEPAAPVPAAPAFYVTPLAPATALSTAPKRRMTYPVSLASTAKLATQQTYVTIYDVSDAKKLPVLLVGEQDIGPIQPGQTIQRSADIPTSVTKVRIDYRACAYDECGFNTYNALVAQ